MTDTLDFQKIANHNPKLHQDSLTKAKEVAEKARNLKVKPPKYNLATPMTPRLLRPIDYNNRLARAIKSMPTTADR